MQLDLLTRDELPPNAITVSNNRLKNWEDCRYKYKLIYESDIPRESHQSKPMRFGEIIHHVWAQYYLTFKGRPVVPLTAKEYDDALLPLTKEYVSWDDKQHLLNALTLLERYKYYSVDNDNFIVIDAEIEFYVYLHFKYLGRPVFFHVIVDLIAEEAGDLMVIDHKSSGAEWSFDDLRFDAQLPFYLNALRQSGVDPQRAYIQWINTYPYKKLHEKKNSDLFKRLPAPVSIGRLEKQYENVVLKIKEMLGAKTHSRKLNRNCKYCPFREVCNHYLDGLDEEKILDFAFTGKVNPDDGPDFGELDPSFSR